MIFRKMTSSLSNHGEMLIHAVVWIYVLSIVVSITLGDNPFGTSLDGVSRTMIILLMLAFSITLTVNSFLLIPRYLKTRKWFKYCLSLLFVGLALTALSRVMRLTDADLVQAPMALALAVSFAYRFTRDWLVNIRLIERLKAEKASMELAFLKSQVDPHFLFNTLNTLYALALEEKGHRTADGIARLGTLMRYSLHDSQAEQIPISKEIDYLEKYIELQRLRTTEQNRVNFAVGTHGWQDQVIAPLLLIPFVENAFKYGISPTEKTFVDIDLRLEGNTLHFRVDNSIVENAIKLQGDGVGLENVRNRLRLLYPAKHCLSCKQVDRQYLVELTLELA